jgi:hypothetical protein
MKKENAAITAGTGSHRRGVFSRERKGVSGTENSFLTVRRLRKTGDAGRKRVCQTADQKENRPNQPNSP